MDTTIGVVQADPLMDSGGLPMAPRDRCRHAEPSPAIFARAIAAREVDAEPTHDEILSVILGFVVSHPTASLLGESLIGRFGSVGATLSASPKRLAAVLGPDSQAIPFLKALHGVVRAVLREPLRDRPILSSSATLHDYLHFTLAHERVEMVRLLFLDTKNGLIKDELHSRGTIDHTPLYPREVVRRVLEMNAKALILVHNHPSGDPTPSKADIEMTRQLASVFKQIDVVLHDHVIVGRNGCKSFRQLGLL